MISIDFLSTLFTVIITLIIIGLTIGECLRIYWVAGAGKRHSVFKLKGRYYAKALKAFWATTMILAMVAVPVFIFIRLPLGGFVSAALIKIAAILVIFFALIELVLSVSLSESLIQRKSKKIVLSICVLVLFPSMIWLISPVGQVFDYPEIEDSYLLELPTRGDWMAGHAGGSVLTNYHNAITSQKYAIDVVKVNEGGWFYQNKGEELTDIYSFGESVYAPVAGVVTTVVDSLPNHEVSFFPSDSLNPAGNHVVIHFDQERYLFMAHLMAGTIEVQKGDSVETGDIVGKIGNSGNTSWPHLHMHIQDKPAIGMEETEAYPFRFMEMERKRWFFWQQTENDFLLRNDFFRE